MGGASTGIIESLESLCNTPKLDLWTLEVFCSQTSLGGCKVSGVVEYQVYDEWRLGKAFGVQSFAVLEITQFADLGMGFSLGIGGSGWG